ncbi:DUF2147 domain-containing protein [Acinetobacter brisouii]|uniref:DUF2147 domain-containing protein n=1 Tax=Acinetobacter brisouii TaxID=396323 RepID=UPI001250CC78|nr:DUF2147 domain-containing protein [Acinetobacter brisouii]
MKKMLLALGLFGAAIAAHAADPLNGTVWQTVDDATNKPKALVVFTEQKNGTLSASIQKVLTAGEENACTQCNGPYKNKSLRGVTIVRGLKNVGGNEYDNGSILDPKNGKTYSLKGELINGGKQLKIRGYLGFSALGRNQTWNRVH